MIKKFYTLFSLFYFLTVSFSFGQLTVTFPSDRVVLQRNNINNATVHIGGYFTECMSRVEARFVPIKSNPNKAELGQPAPSDGGWTIIQATGTCGNFSGSMTVTGGWYRLEVRGIRNGKDPVIGLVQHVGVGEVFLVAGQSNATGGDANPSGPGAAEDAVSSVDFQNSNNETYSNLQLPCPQYVHLDQYTKTAPFGNYAWCWGSFGDKLVEKLHVPVMIFNAGWSATGIENWKQSIPVNGITTAWFGADYPAGLPFGHLRIALNNYIAQSGIRAVLWHQGETDNLVGTSQEKYKNDLRSIIQESRNLSGKPNLPWIVARASRYTYQSPDQAAPSSHIADQIIAAQNDVIGSGIHGNDPNYKLDKVFQGPETDSYWDNNYRSDQVHFAGNGLIFLAQLWADRITDDFNNNSEPYPAIAPARITISASNTSMTFTSADGWNAYNWLNQNNCNEVISSSQQWTAGMGLYRLKTIDSHNNAVLSATLNVSGIVLPVSWKYVRAKAKNNTGATLEWATTNETNASYFAVQRGEDPFVFTSIQNIAAAGNSTVSQQYSYQDGELEAGTYYYRLKQVDKDGKFDYSKIASVRIYGSESVKLFPNPVSDYLSIQSDTKIHSIEIINASGMQILSSPQSANALKLDMTKYSNGIYTIKVNGKSFKILRLFQM